MIAHIGGSAPPGSSALPEIPVIDHLIDIDVDVGRPGVQGELDASSLIGTAIGPRRTSRAWPLRPPRSRSFVASTCFSVAISQYLESAARVPPLLSDLLLAASRAPCAPDGEYRSAGGQHLRRREKHARTMSTANGRNGASEPSDQDTDQEDRKSPDSVPSGAGPQADGDQSDIASGGGTDS